MDFDLDGARKSGYSDSEIASALAPRIGFDLDGAKKAGYSDREIIDALTASPKFSDYAKSVAAGALSGAGMIAQGGGELLARGVNAVAGTELRSENPLKGAIDWLEQSQTPAAKRAVAETTISGNLFDPKTWEFGTDPSVKGLALQGLNAIGQFAPNLAIAIGTAGASVPAQLAIGATVGGLQALGGGAEEERTKFQAMGHDELLSSSRLYRDLVENGVAKDVAKNAVAEAAALGGGLGNAIPSAAEGAFENFLVGALTRGRLHIPGKGIIGKTLVGATGGAAMGGTEEALEQVGQNIGANLAVGGNRPVTADTLQQFVMGAIAEGAAGGGGGALSHVFKGQEPTASPTPAPVDTRAGQQARTAQAVTNITQAGSADEAIAAALYESDVASSTMGEGIISSAMQTAIPRAVRAAREEPAYAQRAAALGLTKEQDFDALQAARRESGLPPERPDDLEPVPAPSEAPTATNPQMHAAWGKVLLQRMEALERAKGATDAGTVRSDQGQLPQEGQVEGGGGAPGGDDVQRQPAEGRNADGSELRAEGGASEGDHRARDEAVARPPAAPALPALQQRLFVERGGKRFEVSSLEEASRKWDAFRDSTGAGSSQIGEGARIVDQDGKEVARISYNGKVWPPGEFKTGQRPLIGQTFKEEQAERARTVDAGAHDAATSPKNELPEPSKAQVLAGNAKLGHERIGKLDYSFENPAGSVREDKHNTPPKWRTPMKGVHYGYARGTVAYDSTPGKKQGVDVFVKEGTPTDWNGADYVVNQKKSGSDAFDEHKTMIGFASEREAKEAYLEHYDAGWEKNILSIVAMPHRVFEAWATDKGKSGPKGGPAKAATIFGKTVDKMTARELEVYSRKARTASQREASAAEIERRREESTLAVPAESHELLRIMAANSGHLEHGGRAIREPGPYGPGGDVVGRTVWVGQPAWAKGTSPEEVKVAVEKAIAGQRLGPQQHALVQTMLQEIADMKASMAEAGTELPAAEQAEIVAAVENEAPPDDWGNMTEAEKNAYLDNLFGPQKPVAEGEGRRAPVAAEEVRPAQAGEREPGQDDEEVAPPRKESDERPALELAAQTTQDLKAKEAQAATGNVEARTAAVRDRNEAILTAPEGTAPARSAEEQKVPTQQAGLFAAADALRSAADAIERAVKPQPEVQLGSFDSEAFDRNRAERIKASREGGARHLDQVQYPSVETMRGMKIYNVHDHKERGTIRTVANTREIVVDWDDEYSAKKNLASPTKEGKRTVYRTWLMPSDMKDYVVADDSKVSVKTAAPSRPRAQPAGESKLTDVGENLWYNRRNFTRGAIDWDTIKDLNDTLKVKEVVKAKVWPKPDYEQLVADGMQPLIARLLKQVYDGIAIAPAGKTDADLQRYIAVIGKVREEVFEWAKDVNANQDFLGAVAEQAKLMSSRRFSISSVSDKKFQNVVLDRLWPAAERGRRFERDTEAWRDIRAIGGDRALKHLQLTLDDAVEAMKDIDKGWPKAQEAWQRQGFKVAPSSEAVVNEGARYARDTHERTTLWTVSTAAGWHGMTIGDSYATKAEAEAAMAALKPFMLLDKRGRFQGGFDTEEQAKDAARELTKREGKGGDIRGMNISQAEREGPERRKGEDITPDRLMSDFGLRGVNFGREGWINQAERQAYLNHAYDALHDLAEILDVPPKALSLNGMLGLAFGAQGRGGSAAAHFVPGHNEINLTKTMGAGTLAHEWGHALDHYFATQGGLSKSSEPYLSAHAEQPATRAKLDASGRKVGTESRYGAELRPEIVQAFKDVVDTMLKRPMTEAEFKAQETMSKNRANEQLERWIQHFRKDIERTDASQLEAFDKFAERMRKGDLGDGHAKVGGQMLTQVVGQVKTLVKGIKNTSVNMTDNYKGLESNAQHVAYLLKEKKATDTHVPQTTNTTYAGESSRKDQEKGGKHYWRTPWEMFARAFETYVADRLAAAKQSNTFLSDAALRAEQKNREGTGYAMPYPRGEERERINGAIDKLVNAIETKESDKGVVMFSRAPTFERDADGPVLVGDGVAIVQPSKWRTSGNMTLYTHMIAVDGHDMGRVTLGWAGDKAVFLPDIRLYGDKQKRGVGEKVLRMLLEHNGPDAEPITIGYITSSAEPFWRKMGTRIYDTGEGNDGAIDLEAYRAARLGASGEDAKFRRPGEGSSAALGEDQGAAGEDRSGAQGREVGDRAAEIRRAIEPIVSRWGNAPEISVINSMADAPAAVRTRDEEQRAKGATGVPDAFIHGGRIYLVASGIRSPAAAVRALLHESVGHYGLHAVFGREIEGILDDVASSMAGRVRTKAAEYGLDLNDAKQRREAAEEVLAELAQTMPSAGVVKRLIAAIRQFLRELGVKLQLSDNDIIANFILPAREFVERGGAGTVGGLEPAFERERPWYYSELERKVQDLKQGTAPVPQWKATIKALKGVTKDEIEWSGINDWLDLWAKGDKIPKDVVVTYLEQNGVKVEETVLGGEGSELTTDDLRVRIDALGYDILTDDIEGEVLTVKHRAEGAIFSGPLYSDDDEQPFDDLPENVKELVLKYDDAARAEAGSRNAEEYGNTRYGNYTLPGGENYRELLLTLPNNVTDEDDAALRREVETLNARMADPHLSQQDFAALSSQRDQVKGVQRKRNETVFRSSHFDEPNILAHVRFNERTDAEGKKVLFIEEVQSDWAQKGKREGFTRPFTQADRKRLAELNAIAARGEQTPADAREWTELSNLSGAARGARDSVPMAPFVGKTEAWVSLALKRMIRWATEHGFDRVAWTSGEQQADRYDLSKHVDRVEIGKMLTGDQSEYYVDAYKDSHRVIQKSSVSENGLADIIGKDLAERAIEGLRDGKVKEKRFSGLDLRIGGEGMRAFYDDVLPKIANRLLEKLGGGRVDAVKLLKTEGTKIPKREVYLEALDYMDHRLNAEELIENTGLDITPQEIDDRLGGPLTPGDRRQTVARAFADEMKHRHAGQKATRQPGFDITPAMREAAGKGLPLFSRAPATDAFKKWFGQSKVVDEDGKPLVVYHGTDAKVNAFDVKPFEIYWGGKELNFKAFYFTDNRSVASSYGRNVMPVYLSMQKPKVVDAKGETWDDFNPFGVIGNTVAEGKHDGIIIKNIRDESSGGGDVEATVYVALKPEQIKSATQNSGTFDAKNPDIRFSRTPSIAGSQTTGDERDSLAAGATAYVRDLMRSDTKFNWWHRTVGTQQHKALVNPDFARVYDESQAFLADVSKYANEAADLAAELLPRVEGFKDFAKKTASQPDIEGATRALYAGTLWGGGSPLEGRVWTDDELKTGRAKDGRVSLPAFQPLSEKQIALYRQALASVGKSLEELGKSMIHRLARRHDIGFDRGMDLQDVAATVRNQVDDQLVDLTAALAQLEDPMFIEDQAGSNVRERARLEREAEKVNQQVTELKDLQTAVADIAQKTETLEAKGYFPAMRFGRFALHVVRDSKFAGEPPEQLYFGLYESQTKANLAVRELEREFPGARIERSVLNPDKHKLFQGLSLDALETFADYITGENGEPIAKDPLVQGFLKAAIAERSGLKRHIHRKGVAGYSDDLPRVLASFTVGSARTVSSNYHAAEMLRLAQGIRAGDVQQEATKLVRYLMDPQEEAQALRGFLFAQFLGGSIAHGLVNMTQPFMVTIPYLSQYTSAADAAAKVAQAAGTRPEKLTGAIRAAYERAKKDGVVAPQEIHQLRAETGGMPIAKNLWLRKLSFLWGSIYAVTEQFNRSSAFIAAYRIAEQKKIADPYTFAANAVNETQFVYNKGNRPNWARGPVGATVFTFKQFSISYLELAKRMYAKDKKAFALMTIMLLAAAGLEGLPFAEDIEDLVDTIGQWMGYATNSKKSLRRWAEATLGKELAQVALHGVSGLPFMPVDVSVRMGMQNLIPGTAMLKLSEKNKARDVLELAGPVGQFVPTEDTMAGKALERIAQGDYMGALRGGAPVAVQNVAKGADMLATGQARDSKGKKITDVSPGEAVLKMAGLQPASVANESRRIGEITQDIDLQRREESEIAEQWARGIADNRPEEVRAAMKKLHDWNHDNPELRIRVTMDQIRRRVKEMRTPRDERIVKNAPPEIRAGVRDQLRQ